MHGTGTGVVAAWVAAAAVFMTATGGAAASGGGPGEDPVFSDPLTIDNPYFPFVTGVTKVYEVLQGHTDAEVRERHLAETRVFQLNGAPVECHTLEEFETEDGEVAEISRNYFAQSDDGRVFYFGETVDIYEDGEVVSHEGSWLVGGPTDPDDPAETAAAVEPAVFMPADPQVGDVFKPEDLFPIVDETAEVIKADRTVRVPAGRFEGCIEVEESSRLSEDTESKWYAPGTGLVKVKEKGEILVFVGVED